jgi:hypothetical protein
MAALETSTWMKSLHSQHRYSKARPRRREVVQMTLLTSHLLAHRVAGVGAVMFLHPLHERRLHLLRRQ